MNFGNLISVAMRLFGGAGAQSGTGTETAPNSRVTEAVAALELTPEQFAEDVASAQNVAREGHPFGGALWFELMKREVNPQFVDEYIDTYPDWAFGEHMPGEHMIFMLRQWARASGGGEADQCATFKQYGLLCGWRPGDINAIWLDVRIGQTADLPAPEHDPLGRTHLPENLVVAPSEVAVYTMLSAKADEYMEAN